MVKKAFENADSSSRVELIPSKIKYAIKLATSLLVNGLPCDRIDMIIEDLDLEPKIDAMTEVRGISIRFAPTGWCQVKETEVRGISIRFAPTGWCQVKETSWPKYGFFGSSNLMADPDAVSMIQIASHLSPDVVKIIQTVSRESDVLEILCSSSGTQSRSLAEAEEEAATEQVHATHARIVIESVPASAKEKTGSKSSRSVVIQDTPSAPKPKPVTSKPKLKDKMGRDVITTYGEAMINSIQNGDQPFPVIAQVSLAGNAQNAPLTLKDPKFWTAKEKKTQKIDLINDLKKYGYKKDNCELNYKFLNNLQPEWKQYGTLMRQTKNLMDINIDALYNIVKQNQGDVNDALGYKKKAVVVTSDPLALVAEKTKVNKRKEKVVVSSNFEGSGAYDFSELKKIIALLAKAFNRRKFYSKPTNNNLRTSSTSQSANKKQEFVKSDDKKVKKKMMRKSEI
nr:nucleolar protein 58-like [Tanacetum cinerariifolium]